MGCTGLIGDRGCYIIYYGVGVRYMIDLIIEIVETIWGIAITLLLAYAFIIFVGALIDPMLRSM